MILILCKCGRMPEIINKKLNLVRCTQIVCSCGRTGAELAYADAKDGQQIRAAAITAWNRAIVERDRFKI